MKPRKNLLIRYDDGRDITIKNIVSETSGTIDRFGFLYIGKEFAGKKGKGFVEKD